MKTGMIEPRISRTLRILNNSRLLARTYGCQSAARFILKNLWR